MKKLLLLVVSVSTLFNSIACTTFFLHKNGQMVFGRNYDWLTETGMVNTNLRGMQKSSFGIEKENITQWVSKYGSITFNQYGKEFPTGGMNEKGLVVELMWLSESQFPAPDERPAFDVLQWIQYQLDNCSTIEEVIATDKKIRINADGAPQHYLIADAGGNAATIEFLNGKMVVHKGGSLPYSVLTNSIYEESVKTVNQAIAQKDPLPFTDNSLQRFGTACSMVKKFQETTIDKPLVDYSFDILNSVSQGSFTKWSIVYDITNKKIHFKTANYGDVKIIEMNSFDLSCKAKPMAFNMSQTVKGNVSEQFIAYSNETNKNKLQEAFTNSKSQITSSEATENAMAQLASNVKCNEK